MTVSNTAVFVRSNRIAERIIMVFIVVEKVTVSLTVANNVLNIAPCALLEDVMNVSLDTLDRCVQKLVRMGASRGTVKWKLVNVLMDV